jgi:hypothetical protein
LGVHPGIQTLPAYAIINIGEQDGKEILDNTTKVCNQHKYVADLGDCYGLLSND